MYNNPFYNRGSYNYMPFNQPNSQQSMQPMYQQNMMQQPIQQVAQPEVPIQEIRFMTAKDINGYILLPNQKSLLIDRASNLAHIKYTNAMGESSERVFSYKELDDKTTDNGETAEKTTANFVEKTEKTLTLKSLEKDTNKRFEQIQMDLSAIANDIEIIKKVLGGK